MSNYLGIATITATLQRTLQSNIQSDIDGARVTTIRPDRLSSGAPEAGVNIFLYDVLLNPAWRSADLRRRHSEEKYIKQPQSGLDLYYLFTCYGNEVELEPQRLMGSVVRTFHNGIIVTQEMIRETIADSTYAFLLDSNLADQVEVMAISSIDMNVEEISKIWSIFFQTPYSLSIAYKASVVLIDSGDIPTKPLPIRNLQRHVTPYQPVILQLKAIEELGTIWRPYSTIAQLFLATSTLVIQGNRLSADTTEIRIGDVITTPSSVSDTKITLDIASIPRESLRSGLQSLQVIHPEQKVSSNIVPILLRPTIVSITVSNLKGRGSEGRSADITVVVNLIIDQQQDVALVLSDISLIQAKDYSFNLSKHRRTTSDTITFAITGCLPGTYLARLMVDSAESLLNVDTNRDSPTFDQYIEPTVVI